MLLIEYDIDLIQTLQGNCLTCMVLGNFKIIENEYINVLHVHQKKGNAKWVKDPARRNSRQVIIFVCLLKVFSSYALLYMYLFMLGNRGKQKYDVRDILGDNILRFKCRGQIRNPWKLTSVAWDSRGVTPWCNSSTVRMSLLLNRGTEVES